jgi:hypothetical protein
MKQPTDYRIDGLGKGMCLKRNDSTADTITSIFTYTSNNNHKNNKTTKNGFVCL